MNCLQRAFRYVSRKKVRTLLLLLTLTASCAMILGTLTIRGTTETILNDLRENAESKLLLECTDSSHPLTEEDISLLTQNEEISWINPIYQCHGTIEGLSPVGDPDGEFAICAQYKIEKDSPFEDKRFRLIDGSFPQNNHEVLLHKTLAEGNGLRIGDQIFSNFTLCGVFLSGAENMQTDNVETVNRIENQVFLCSDGLKSEEGMSLTRVACYLKDPDALEDTKLDLKKHFGDRISINADNHTYLKMQLTIGQTEKITFLIFFLTVVTGCFVTWLLLSMWMRERKREIAVFRSIGITTHSIVIQLCAEVLCVYVVSFGLAVGLVKAVLPVILKHMNLFEKIGDSASVSSSSLLFFSGIAGVGVVVILAGIAMIPYLRKHPKEILSEMEG